jgi:hypothetical protein
VGATDRDPRRALRTAFQDFNDASATGEIEQTEKYASAMVALIPCNLSLLNAALSSEPDFALATSAGVPLIWQKLQATAARLRSQAAVFDFYPRWHIKSILKYCDVPFLIVLHIIGGTGGLRQVARPRNVSDLQRRCIRCRTRNNPML